MKNSITAIAVVLILLGAINAIFACVMIAASKNPQALTTSIQESKIDDLARSEGFQDKISKTYSLYLFISIGIIALGVFAFFYLKKLSVSLSPTIEIKFGDSFLWSAKSQKEKG